MRTAWQRLRKLLFSNRAGAHGSKRVQQARATAIHALTVVRHSVEPLGQHRPLPYFAPPQGLPQLAFQLAWHMQRDSDAVRLWLRQQVRECSQQRHQSGLPMQKDRHKAVFSLQAVQHAQMHAAQIAQPFRA